MRFSDYKILSFSGKTIWQILVFSLVIFSFSCKKRELLIADQSQDVSYFPLYTGFWAEYAVDSVVHYDIDDISQVDTAIGRYHFFVREEIDTSFLDGENEKAYVILRYRRESDTLPWSFMNVWTAKITPYSAQRVEDNIRFVRLHFPISYSSSWEGNDFNFFMEEEYSYEDLYKPLQFGSLKFDSTISVLQNDFISHINRIFKKEIYGAHAGLLYKQIDSVNTRNTDNGTIILNGLEYKLSITGYKH